MSDYANAKGYVTKWYDEQESIIRSMVTAAQNAVNNFDNTSEIPEESKAWDWDVVKIIVKAAITRIPQFRVALAAFDEIVEAGKKVNEKYKISDRVENGMKIAKAVGIKLEFKKDSPPEVAELKKAAIKARDGLGKWERATLYLFKKQENFFTIDETVVPAEPGLLAKLQAGIEAKDSNALKYNGRLYQTMVELLGPVPAYTPEVIEKFGIDTELDLYKECYTKGAYIYIMPPNPNWKNPPTEPDVRGIPKNVLDRVKELTHSATYYWAVRTWNLPQRVEQCNSCHSPNRMRPINRPMDPLRIQPSGIPNPRDNGRTPLKPFYPDGQPKNFGDWDTQRMQLANEWLQRNSR
jgi:hypothetical protein